MEGKQLTFSLDIQAPTAVVYRAFTNGPGMGEWFADLVEADPQPGGRFYAWWHGGFYTVGTYVEVEKDHRAVFTWHAKGEPAPTQVEIRITPQGEGAHLELIHSGLGEGEAWDRTAANFTREWTSSFSNLKSVLETGVDKRLFDRPMLGFFIGGLNNPDHAAQLGVPVTTGIMVAGVVDGMGAQASGLKANDVIVEVNGVETPELNTMRSALAGKKGGDVVSMDVYRGAEKVALSVELSRRPVPPFPAAPAELADQLRQMYGELNAEIDAIFEGVTDEEADFRPAPSEWCAKETLAHLLVSEQWGVHTILNALDGNPPANYPSFEGLYTAMAAISTLPEMLDTLKKTQSLMVALVSMYPDFMYERKGAYFILHANPQGEVTHFRGHYDQIKKAIAAARETKE